MSPAWPSVDDAVVRIAAQCHRAGGDGAPAVHEDAVPEEVPVAIEVDGLTQAVMMATPADLEDFAVGFALTEGWIAGAADVRDVDHWPADDGLVLALRIAPRRAQALASRRRTLAGRTGCGLCGIDRLAHWRRPAPPRPVHPDGGLPVDALVRGAAAASDAQRLHRACGGLHAAAWLDADGQLVALREDVGRHNALDKLAGARARAGVATGGVAWLSSRVSHELVDKAAWAGFYAVAGASAPTALAIRSAGACGLALWGFVRDLRATRYA